MSLYRPYTSEPTIQSYTPIEPQDVDYVDTYAKLLKDNLTRFLGVPQSIQPNQECDEPAS